MKTPNQIIIVLLTSNLIGLNAGVGLGQQLVKVDAQNRSCEPVAKIISGDSRYKPMTKLCQEDSVSGLNGGVVKILCYTKGDILVIPRGLVGDHCSSVISSGEGRGCSLLQGRDCVVNKGPTEENTPRRITPYGVVILNPRPTLSWASITSATKYSVEIEGIGVNWEVEVVGNSLVYPKDKPPLEAGNVYSVNILAMKNDEVVVGSSSALLLLPKDKLPTETIDTLKSLKQSEDELAIDMDAVYSAHDLIDESINTLNSRVKAGSLNPTIHRLLGDRYLMANLPEAANKAYLKAKELAQKNNNAWELKKIQAGIKIANKHL